MRRHQSTFCGGGWCAVSLLGVALFLSGCGDAFQLMDVNLQNPAPAQAAKPDQEQQKELNRPLLRELRKYVEAGERFR